MTHKSHPLSGLDALQLFAQARGTRLRKYWQMKHSHTISFNHNRTTTHPRPCVVPVETNTSAVSGRLEFHLSIISNLPPPPRL